MAIGKRGGRVRGIALQKARSGPAKGQLQVAAVRTKGVRPRVTEAQKRDFFAYLSETSNAKLSAERAGISESSIYRYRQVDPVFAADWQRAYRAGCEAVKMELLCRLRFGSERVETIEKIDGKIIKRVHSFENALTARVMDREDRATSEVEMDAVREEDPEVLLERLREAVAVVIDGAVEGGG